MPMQLVRTHVVFNPAARRIELSTRCLFFVLHRKHHAIDGMQRIDAFNRDAVTHDEIFVRFHTEGGGISVSEFDVGFEELIESLKSIFPGIERWADVTPVVALTEATLLLWERDPLAGR